LDVGKTESASRLPVVTGEPATGERKTACHPEKGKMAMFDDLSMAVVVTDLTLLAVKTPSTPMPTPTFG